VEFAVLHLEDFRGSGPGLIAFRSVLAEKVVGKVVGKSVVVRRGVGDGAGRDRPTFWFVTGQQVRTGPAVDACGQFPGHIDPVANAGVVAVATQGGFKWAASPAMTRFGALSNLDVISQQHAAVPFVGGQDLDRDVVADQRADHARGIPFAAGNTQTLHKGPPRSCQLHAAHDAGGFREHDPEVATVTERHPLREPWRSEQDRQIGSHAGLTLQPRVQGGTNDAGAPVSPWTLFASWRCAPVLAPGCAVVLSS